MRRDQTTCGGWLKAAVLLLWMLGSSMLAAEENAAPMTMPTHPTMPGVLTLAKFDKTPTIDGKMEKGEWARAAKVTGFLDDGRSPWGTWGGRGWLDPRSGSTYVGYTADQLYIAVVSELPPDDALITKQDQDEVMSTVGDDSIEVWVTDPSDPETQYQYVVNAVGAAFDVKHAPAGADQSWDADIEIANTVDTAKGVWIAEMAAPLKAFGITSDPTGGKLKLLVARNFKRPWSQATFMPGWISFRAPDTYATVRLTADEPVVRIESLGEYGGRGESLGALFEEANLKLHLRVLNPGPARQAQVKILAQSTDMPERHEKKQIDLPAKGEAVYEFELPVGFYHGSAAHMINFEVGDAQSDATWASTGFMWTQADPSWKRVRPEAWNVQTGPQPEKALNIAYYPSYDRLEVIVDPEMLGHEFADVTRAQLRISDSHGKDVHEETLTWEKSPATLPIALPRLRDGKYAVAMQFPGYTDAVTHTFTRQSFKWEGNRLGITGQVLPPFTPSTSMPPSTCIRMTSSSGRQPGGCR